MIQQGQMYSAWIRQRRRLASGAAAAVLLAGWVAPVYAEATIDTAVEDLAPMNRSELDEERGGFSVGNMNVSFGLSVTTTIAGDALGPGVSVTTHFTVNSPGDLKSLGTTVAQGQPDQPASGQSAPKPLVEVTFVSGPDAPPPPNATTPEALGAAVDPATGNVTLALGSGNSVLVEFIEGQVARIENTEDNIRISTEYKADFVIEGFHPIATASNLREQVHNLTDQLMAVGAFTPN